MMFEGFVFACPVNGRSKNPISWKQALAFHACMHLRATLLILHLFLGPRDLHSSITRVCQLDIGIVKHVIPVGLCSHLRCPWPVHVCMEACALSNRTCGTNVCTCVSAALQAYHS